MEVVALRGLDLSVNWGLIAVIGASGSGKSTCSTFGRTRSSLCGQVMVGTRDFWMFGQRLGYVPKVRSRFFFGRQPLAT
ncbi:MAG: hypothetical protein CM1200mP27_12650 [Chloroflexota bacterium]|nr:MAG: hypothetical protein CM1200mP27_12650 [Chloroflexota bacterium]